MRIHFGDSYVKRRFLELYRSFSILDEFRENFQDIFLDVEFATVQIFRCGDHDKQVLIASRLLPDTDLRVRRFAHGRHSGDGTCAVVHVHAAFDAHSLVWNVL